MDAAVFQAPFLRPERSARQVYSWAVDQAVVRAAPDQQDKGGGAAAAALHLIALQRRWSGTRRPVGFAPEDRDPVRLAGALDGSSLA